MWATDRQICIVLLLFGFFCLVCSLPSELVDVRKCKKSNGDFPKLGSLCRSYYKCNNWIPVEMICPLDQHFFPAKGYCVWPEEFPCLDKPNTEQCPEPNGKFLKPSTNCKVYYDCCNGRPSEKKCPGDTLFDSSRSKCDWPELVACPDDHPKSKECPLANGNFLKPGSNCKYYYECSNFKPTVKKCCGDTVFDQTRGKCDWSELVDCADDGTSTKNIFSSTLASTTRKESPAPSSSTKDKITTVTSNPTSSRTLTPDSDEDSSEEGKTSEESKEHTTKYKVKSTYPTISTVSSSIFEKITTPIIFTEDLKETSSSTTEKSTDFPVTSNKSFSTIATSTGTKPKITTVLEVSTVSGMSTRSTSRIDVTSYPVVVTDETSTKTADDVSYKLKDSTVTTSSVTDVVTYHIFCPKPDGYFPHPTNKHQFIACVGGNPTIMDCPSNLVYDHKTKSCQYKRKNN